MSLPRPKLGQLTDLLHRSGGHRSHGQGSVGESHQDAASGGEERPGRRTSGHWSAPRHDDGSRNYLVFALEVLFVSIVAYFWL